MMLCLAAAQKPWTQQPWAETSKTMSQSKSFFLKVAFLRYFVTVTKKKPNIIIIYLDIY
jgi:hypothetical protein